MPLDRNRLAKLMAMTTSDKDPEALSALRMANKMLSAERTTWGDVLKDAPREVRVSVFHDHGEQTAGDWEMAPHLKDKSLITTMFNVIYTQPRTGSEDMWRWVDDIHDKFLKYGQLTKGQFDALRQLYQKVT